MDLALDNEQMLICHTKPNQNQTKPTNQPTKYNPDDKKITF